MILYQCKKCGSLDIEVKVWVKLNGHAITERDQNDDDVFCPVCKDLDAEIEEVGDAPSPPGDVGGPELELV